MIELQYYLTNLPDCFIYGLLAMGIYISLRILDIPDLTTEGSFGFGAGQEVYLAHALYTRRCGLLCAYMDGLPSLRSQAGTERAVDCSGFRTCHVLQGLSAGIYGACKEIRREIHTLT